MAAAAFGIEEVAFGHRDLLEEEMMNGRVASPFSLRSALEEMTPVASKSDSTRYDRSESFSRDSRYGRHEGRVNVKSAIASMR
jgi:hypothetical protein